MAENLHLDIIAPDRLVLRDEVEQVVAPGELGEFGILPGHRPFVTVLIPGELKYIKDGMEHKLVIWGGIVEVKGDKVIVLADQVESPEDIDTSTAAAELKELEEKLKDFDGEVDELREINTQIRLAEIRSSVRA